MKAPVAHGSFNRCDRAAASTCRRRGSVSIRWLRRPRTWSRSGRFPADQDAFALRSQQRFSQALQRGFFRMNWCPSRSRKRSRRRSWWSWTSIPRPETTLEALGKLKGVVRPDGSVTAGHSSGLNDGAAAVLMTSEEAVAHYGLTPRARIVAGSVAGVTPRIMGIGPVPATRKLLALANLKLANIDVIELNEAFAAQSLAVLRDLGLPDDAEHVKCEWRRDRCRPSARCQWSAPRGHRAQPARSWWRTTCPMHHVHRRRSGRCAADRTARLRWAGRSSEQPT